MVYEGENPAFLEQGYWRGKADCLDFLSLSRQSIIAKSPACFHLPATSGKSEVHEKAEIESTSFSSNLIHLSRRKIF